MDNDREPIEATVVELRPRMKSVSITFKVMEIGEEREVTSRRDGETHRVLDVVVGDSTGIVRMPFWNAMIDEVAEGKTYLLTNGYTTLFRGNLRLNIGRYGELTEAEEEIEEVNMELDMSEEEHEYARRRRDYGDNRSYSRSY